MTKVQMYITQNRSNVSLFFYQQQHGEEAVKDVVPVGEIPSPAKGKDLHTHFKQVIEDEAQVDDLLVGQ